MDKEKIAHDLTILSLQAELKKTEYVDFYSDKFCADIVTKYSSLRDGILKELKEEK